VLPLEEVIPVSQPNLFVCCFVTTFHQGHRKAEDTIIEYEVLAILNCRTLDEGLLFGEVYEYNFCDFLVAHRFVEVKVVSASKDEKLDLDFLESNQNNWNALIQYLADRVGVQSNRVDIRMSYSVKDATLLLKLDRSSCGGVALSQYYILIPGLSNSAMLRVPF